jgi:hypothetical protein
LNRDLEEKPVRKTEKKKHREFKSDLTNNCHILLEHEVKFSKEDLEDEEAEIVLKTKPPSRPKINFIQDGQ